MAHTSELAWGERKNSGSPGDGPISGSYGRALCWKGCDVIESRLFVVKIAVFPQIASTLPAFINTFFVSFFIKYFLCILYHSLNAQIRATNTAKISDLHDNFVEKEL